MELSVKINVEDAKKLQPKLEEAIAYQKADKFSEAAKLYQEILNIIPQHPDALHLLGVVMYKLGKSSEALTHVKKAIDVAPRVAEYHNSLGLIYVNRGEHNEATDCFKNALDINPEYIEANGNLLYELQNKNECMDLLNNLEKIADSNNNFNAYRFLAKYYRQNGKFDDAILFYEKALSANPDDVYSYEGLVSCKKCTIDDKSLVLKMEKLAESGRLPISMCSVLYFSLGKIFDDTGDYESAFKSFEEGNRLKKEEDKLKGETFDRARFDLYISRLKSVFSPGYINKIRNAGIESEQPLFIVGLPRSGTTLIEQILSSHEKICGAGELKNIEIILNSLPDQLNTTRSYPKCLQRMNTETYKSLAIDYMNLYDESYKNFERVVDKMPGNFLNLGLIIGMFRNPRIIHSRRDALDVCLSMYFQRFAKHHLYAYDLSDLGFYYRMYEHIMDYWRNEIQDKFIEIDYENLVSKQTSVIEKIIDYCGLGSDKNCYEFYKTERIVKTASDWQVRQPIYNSSVGKWKKYENYIAPLKKALEL